MANELKDAIADANRIRTLAVENAKAAIQETFQPQIQRMISTKLSEEDEFSSEEDDLGGIEFEPEMGENAYIDDGEDGTPADNLPEGADDGGMQITEEELNSMIRELESEDEFGAEEEFGAEGGEEFGAEGGEEFGGEFGAEEEFGAEGGEEFGAEGGEEFPEDEVIETVMRQIQKELSERRGVKKVSTQPTKQSPDTVKLRRVIQKLQSEINEVRKANVVLKTAVNEVNLLNAKLMYASKLVRGHELSDAQHENILESLDRSKTTREAELIYRTLTKQFVGAARKNSAAQPQRNKLGATKPITEGKAAKTGNEYEFASRWKVLAGLSGRNY